jgi:hypothetical protein
MGSKLLSARFACKDLGRLRLWTLMKFCGASMASGAFVSLVGFSRPFDDELLGIVVLAKLTAGVFPASRGVPLSTV